MSVAEDAREVAVVTGGTGGLGSAICHGLAQSGVRVFVGYNSAETDARTLAADLPGGGHVPLRLPVTDSRRLHEAAADVWRKTSRCDIVVNCAGTTRFVPHDDLDRLDDRLFDEIVAVNLRGPFAVTRAFRPHLEQSPMPGGAAVVNISSIAATTAMGSNVAYCASKAGLDTITRALARALAPKIRVVSVAPGLVETDFVKGLDQGWRDEQAARTPLGRLASPAEVAHAVVAAARTLTFSTGVTIAVDGGRPLG